MEEIYLEEAQLHRLVSVDRFKRQSEGMQAIIVKVETDLERRYTPFNSKYFDKFSKDLKDGMELIAAVSECNPCNTQNSTPT